MSQVIVIGMRSLQTRRLKILVKELILIHYYPENPLLMMIPHHHERYALCEMFMIHVCLP